MKVKERTTIRIICKTYSTCDIGKRMRSDTRTKGQKRKKERKRKKKKKKKTID